MSACSRRKQYVEVLCTHYIDGAVRPRRIIFADGSTFEIDEARGPTRAKTSRSGEIAYRYSVKIKGKETFLYSDSGRFFVEMKEVQ